MTTIQSLRLMAEGNASLTSEETYAYLTRAASELSALQRSLNGIKQEAQGYKDDHLKCVHWCCENGLGESTDNATDEVLKQLSALQKENAELKKWKEEDPRMLREQIRVADVAFNALQERYNSLRTQNRELREALELIYSRTTPVAAMLLTHDEIAEIAKQALALQPEK